MGYRIVAMAVMVSTLWVRCVPICAQPPEDDDYPPSVQLGRWVGDLKVGPRMNAAGRDLHGSAFVSQDLRGAVFSEADLSEVQFTNCDLSGASFKGAIFARSRFDVCKLDDANLDDATINGPNPDSIGLTTAGAHLSDKQIQSTRSYRTKKLIGCTIAGSKWESARPLVKYDFRGANLIDAYLIDGDFSDCDFTDARIDGLRLVGARITFQQLASTWNYKARVLREDNPRLPKLKLDNTAPFEAPDQRPLIGGNVDFRTANLTGLSIMGRPLCDADFTDANIAEAFFLEGITKSQLCSTWNYKAGNLSRIEFYGTDLSNLDLSGQNLTGGRYGECILSGANLRDAVVSDCNFSYARGLTLAQIKSTWNYKHGRMTGVILPKELADALQKEKSSDKQEGTQPGQVRYW